MAVQTLQVTIGASATQVTALPLRGRWVQFQNNAAHNAHIGDVNVSSSRGIQLASGSPGGGFFIPPTEQTNAAGTGFTVLCGTTDTSTYNYDILN
jgi:hypothetical protein